MLSHKPMMLRNAGTGGAGGAFLSRGLLGIALGLIGQAGFDVSAGFAANGYGDHPPGSVATIRSTR